MREGRGPIWMDTVTALGNLRETLSPREVKHLEGRRPGKTSWDMWSASVVSGSARTSSRREDDSELMPTEPYLLGSHSGCCGIWVSGPDDVGAPSTEEPEAGVPEHLPRGWNWGYRSMTTVGACSPLVTASALRPKFSSGSHAEGRLAAKAMVRFVMARPRRLDASVEELVAEQIYKPVKNLPGVHKRTTRPRST